MIWVGLLPNRPVEFARDANVAQSLGNLYCDSRKFYIRHYEDRNHCGTEVWAEFPLNGECFALNVEL